VSSELTQRLGQANLAQQQSQQLLKPGARPTTVTQLFQYKAFRGELNRTLNDEGLVRRLLQAGLTELARIPKLAECSWQSMAGALMQCATVKLEPGPAMGHCWILPFKGTATFVLGYPGVVQLAFRSGLVADIMAESVCEGEEFWYDSGANVVGHKRPTRGRRGEAYAYYSIVRYVNGGRHIEFMTRQDVEDHAQRHSKSYQSRDAASPWRTDFDDMAEKTCVLQGKKKMPASVEWIAATAADEQATIWTPGSGLRPEDVVQALPEPAEAAEPPVSPPTAEEFESMPLAGTEGKP
jgi:recombination protein RecT